MTEPLFHGMPTRRCVTKRKLQGSAVQKCYILFVVLVLIMNKLEPLFQGNRRTSRLQRRVTESLAWHTLRLPGHTAALQVAAVSAALGDQCSD